MTEETPAALRIGEFEFRPATGELRRLGISEEAVARRLQPQPALLLALLAASKGELVTRDEIRSALWPDTHVDLDQSLSFCVRQLRAAFADSATQPRYIETLPKRGYRLLQPVTPIGETVETAAPALETGGRRTPGGRLLVGALALIVLAALSVWWIRAGAGGASIRVAVMPFELAAGGSEAGPDLARISEWLVVELARADRVEIIGPRSTARYAGDPFPDLKRLASELEVDFVLNARWLADEPQGQLIVELIRLADGSHPWVERFATPWRWEQVASAVREQVLLTLDRAPLNDRKGGGT